MTKKAIVTWTAQDGHIEMNLFDDLASAIHETASAIVGSWTPAKVLAIEDEDGVMDEATANNLVSMEVARLEKIRRAELAEERANPQRFEIEVQMPDIDHPWSQAWVFVGGTKKYWEAVEQAQPYYAQFGPSRVRIDDLQKPKDVSE